MLLLPRHGARVHELEALPLLRQVRAALRPPLQVAEQLRRRAQLPVFLRHAARGAGFTAIQLAVSAFVVVRFASDRGGLFARVRAAAPLGGALSPLT